MNGSGVKNVEEDGDSVYEVNDSWTKEEESIDENEGDGVSVSDGDDN